jgi:tetratricopeptide (TPR) repeat protein
VPGHGAAPGAAAALAPAQLPRAVTEFTGRAAELHELDRLLGDERPGTASGPIAVVTGAPGVGKTALAVHWGQRVSHRFGDGQLYVNLRGYAAAPPMRPIDALGQLLRGLGVDPRQHPVDVEEAASMYRTLLATRKVLVLLDNAASPDQIRPLLPGNPACFVLVTSRDRLSGLVAREGARQLRVEVLPAAESVTLLARLVGEDRVSAEPTATAGLAGLCAHLPLALRIAAATLAGSPHRGVGQFAAELERIGENRLAALEVEGDTHAAVRAAFDLSYGSLPPPARRAFRRLGLAPGPDVTAPAAAALAGTSAEKAAGLLERLAAAHLIGEHSPGRYRFHDLLRLYARRRARAEDGGQARQAAAGRLLTWYLSMTGAAAGLLYPHLLRLTGAEPAGQGGADHGLAGGEPPDREPAARREAGREPASQPGGGLGEGGFGNRLEALAWLDAERPNLIAAITDGAGHGHTRLAWLLADTLRGYFALRRHTVDWLTAAQAARDAAASAGDARAQSAAELSLAHARWSMGDYPAAMEHYAVAGDLAARAGWAEGQATILGNLGLVYWEIGRMEEAADHLNRALSLDRQYGREAGAANHLANLGYVYRALGRLDEASEHCAQALACYRELGFSGGEANALANLGLVYHDLGRLDLALGLLNEALALYQQIGDRSNEADTRVSLATAHRSLGHHARATALAESGLALAREIGDRRTQADALNVLGMTSQDLGNYPQAVDHHTSALELALATGARYQEAEALAGLCLAHRQLGNADRARTCSRRALAIAQQTGDHRVWRRVRAVTDPTATGVAT